MQYSGASLSAIFHVPFRKGMLRRTLGDDEVRRGQWRSRYTTCAGRREVARQSLWVYDEPGRLRPRRPPRAVERVATP
jgi:hypothetical protein